uniref:(northern house mosquito) hypothetical protein n=1 Tax=Culex pipiens TaxID=7175 RepID=A0A8D8F308_CULPI
MRPPCGTNSDTSWNGTPRTVPTTSRWTSTAVTKIPARTRTNGPTARCCVTGPPLARSGTSVRWPEPACCGHPQPVTTLSVALPPWPKTANSRPGNQTRRRAARARPPAVGPRPTNGTWPPHSGPGTC